MVCPVDNAQLVMTDRQGVEIDYCPTCRGVWLDRGELDKIIDRGAAYEASQAAPQPHRPDDRAVYRDEPRRDDYRGDHYRDDDRSYGDSRKKRKREGFLGEMFDFGD